VTSQETLRRLLLANEHFVDDCGEVRPVAAQAAALGYDIAATPEEPGGSPTARRITLMALERKGWP
jgi:hypothetical protein